MNIDTEQKVKELKDEILEVAITNKKGHIASSLSCLDILAVLYYEILSPDDTVILSKGHGCYGLYAIWSDLGLIDKETWKEFRLSGCLDNYGSLGHGLPIAVGQGFANKILKNNKHVYCIVGDGELQEGSMWEALSFMFHHNLINVTVIVDNNRLQAMDRTNKIIFADVEERLKGIGFVPFRCDGHNHNSLRLWLKSKPAILIADTVKGKGVDYMENNPIWHYRCPKCR